MTSDRVVVIGAGIGGLAAAIELSACGLPVLVLERAEAVGGKMRQVVADGVGIDAGPTVLTLRGVFEALFARAGTTLEAALTLRPAERLARHAWRDGSRLDLFADIGRSADAVGVFAGRAAAQGYREFCARSARIFATLEPSFIAASRPSLPGLVARAGPRALAGISPFSTLWQALGAHFEDPRLRQLFGRYATYCGSSPFSAPATLMLVAHVEQSGVWMVEGGMQRAERLALPGLQLLGLRHDAGRRHQRDALAARVIVQELQRGIAEPALRRVEDALEGEIVGRLRHAAQVGQRVADLEPLVEPRAADHAIRQAERDEALFELAHLERGANEDGDLLQRMALALELLDRLADGARLFLAVPHARHGRLLAPSSPSVNSVLPSRPSLRAMRWAAVARMCPVDR